MSSRDNKLGLFGWAFGGWYGPERYAFTLQRITGLSILLYLVMHVFVTAPRLWGQGAWESIMAQVDKPLFKLGEYALFCAVAIHALNGLRLILSESGFILPAPKPPEYPYPTCLAKQRPMFYAVMALAMVVVVMGGVDALKDILQLLEK
ncbi:MAG: succinate dehydrogenase, cytochrome b556 subunit [Elusimicrobiota bacterium]